eukprot:ctg_321.g92
MCLPTTHSVPLHAAFLPPPLAVLAPSSRFSAFEGDFQSKSARRTHRTRTAIWRWRFVGGSGADACVRRTPQRVAGAQGASSRFRELPGERTRSGGAQRLVRNGGRGLVARHQSGRQDHRLSLTGERAGSGGGRRGVRQGGADVLQPATSEHCARHGHRSAAVAGHDRHRVLGARHPARDPHRQQDVVPIRAGARQLGTRCGARHGVPALAVSADTAPRPEDQQLAHRPRLYVEDMRLWTVAIHVGRERDDLCGHRAVRRAGGVAPRGVRLGGGRVQHGRHPVGTVHPDANLQGRRPSRGVP